jgi:hypothetical protein
VYSLFTSSTVIPASKQLNNLLPGFFFVAEKELNTVLPLHCAEDSVKDIALHHLLMHYRPVSIDALPHNLSRTPPKKHILKALNSVPVFT